MLAIIGLHHDLADDSVDDVELAAVSRIGGEERLAGRVGDLEDVASVVKSRSALRRARAGPAVEVDGFFAGVLIKVHFASMHERCKDRTGWRVGGCDRRQSQRQDASDRANQGLFSSSSEHIPLPSL